MFYGRALPREAEGSKGLGCCGCSQQGRWPWGGVSAPRYGPMLSTRLPTTTVAFD